MTFISRVSVYDCGDGWVEGGAEGSPSHLPLLQSTPAASRRQVTGKWRPSIFKRKSTGVWSLLSLSFPGRGQGGPGPSQFFRTTKRSAFSTNAQSRLASVVVDGVLGPPCLARHTWRCPCISVVPEARHEMETRELLGETAENSVSPKRCHWFALQANQ